MDANAIYTALITWLGLVILLTFHEFGHAWMAWKCGDDTARSLGRCSLNPLVHIDLIGTVLLPLIMFLSPTASRFLIGWAKPVPVVLENLKNPRLDDILVSMAGPWMNLFLAVVLIGLAKLGSMFGFEGLMEAALPLAKLSLLLCFFNLLPIPPLDGSRVVRSLIGMTYETYAKIAQFGFILVIIVLQFQAVRNLISGTTNASFKIISTWFSL